MNELLRFTATGTIGINILFPPKFEFVFYNDKLEIYKKAKLIMTVSYTDIHEVVVIKNWQNNVIFNCKPKSFNIYKLSIDCTISKPRFIWIIIINYYHKI